MLAQMLWWEIFWLKWNNFYLQVIYQGFHKSVKQWIFIEKCYLKTAVISAHKLNDTHK